MSQDQSQDAAYITIVPVSPFEFPNNNNEQTAAAVVVVSNPVELLTVCPTPTNNGNDNDPNANNDNGQPSSSAPNDPQNSPLNSEALQVQLTSVQGNNGRGHNENEEVPILEFQTKYPIIRYSRKWKRPEVQGFCCLAIEIICLATLAVLGLHAIGYFDSLRPNDHLPLSFSWKILWEFFGNSALPKQLTDCLFGNRAGKLIIREDEETYTGLDPVGPMDVNYFMESLASSSDEVTEKPKLRRQALVPTFSTDENACEFRQAKHSMGWLAKFFVVTNFMPVLNIVASSVLYTSLSIRRRKGMQILLLLPSFFCFFVSIFQQIPISFQYNYFDQALIKEMHTTLVQSVPPFNVIPILDETQSHHQCCGIEYPGNWELVGPSIYPPSCCNTSAFDCSKLEMIHREHTWSVGCFQIEHDKVHHFERWALFLYALKVVAEVGIFCTLSDITRFDYPPPETQETSRCDFREYQIRCRGVVHIKGVTKDGHIVAESKYFLPWRLIPSRTDMIHGLILSLKTDQNQTKGSVEVIKRHHVDTFLDEDIQIDLSRKNRGIFVFTLL